MFGLNRAEVIGRLGADVTARPGDAREMPRRRPGPPVHTPTPGKASWATPSLIVTVPSPNQLARDF